MESSNPKFNEFFGDFKVERKIYNEDVLLGTGNILKSQRGNSICVSSNGVISLSNHFLHYPKGDKRFETKYGIYDGICRCYNNIMKRKESLNNKYYNDNVYFYMINSFMFSNSGHDLSIMLSFIKTIKDNGYKHLLILKGYKDRNNYKLLLPLFDPSWNVYELEDNEVYKFKHIVFARTYHFDLYKSSLIDDIVNNVAKKIEDYEDVEGKNILLVKCCRNKEIVRRVNMVKSEKLIQLFEDNGFIYLNPEEMDIFKIALYLLHARKIVFSDGAICYTHMLFFNMKAKHILVTKLQTCIPIYMRDKIIKRPQEDLLDDDFPKYVNEICNI